jgi:CxxC motif-containing protein
MEMKTEIKTSPDRKREFVCIVCPVGCSLIIDGEGESPRVSGNQCKRGEVYGKQEYLRPMRMVTSSVAVDGGAQPLCSVKTEREIDKAKIFEAIEAIRSMRVRAPVEIGQTIAQDIAGTGVRLIATTADAGRSHTA